MPMEKQLEGTDRRKGAGVLRSKSPWPGSH